MPRLRRSSQTLEDLNAAWLWIAQFNVSAADRLLHDLDAAFHLLVKYPFSGTSRPEFTGGNLRSYTCRGYVIYFRSDPGGIEIARVLHGSRDHESLLQDD